MKKLLLLFVLSTAAFAQNYRADGIVLNRTGTPIPGATIAVCSQVAITAISEVVGTVTVTTTLSPPQGSTVTIVGVTPTAYNGSYKVLTTSGTNFTYTNPTQGLGAGTIFGSVVVTSTTPCAPLANLCSSYTDLVCASPNPVTGDGVGNYSFYVAPGHYTRQFYGSGLTARIQTDQVFSCDPSANCSSSGTITANNFVSTVATGTAPFTVTSTTQVPNLNVSQLEGATWEAPGTIGSTTPNSGAFTTLSGTAVTGTTFNKVTVTAPATSATLTIANGKTATVNNSLTLAGVDGTTQTFQASDTIVGRATTDPLSNKTLTGASSGNSVNLLNQQQQLSPVTGTGADAVLYTYTLPGNTLGAGKCLEVSLDALHGAGAASPSYKLKLGATALWTISGGASARHFTAPLTHICNNAGVTNAQSGFIYGAIDNATITGTANFTSNIDTTTNQTISFTFNVANTDTVTPEIFIVKLLQ